MDSFVVSARKYRPQTFDTVVGQSHITTTLKNAIAQNQLAHAFLFCGPRGVGKTTCARILAKTINCEKRLPNGEACDTCSSCKSFNEGTSLNIHELDAASNNSVDDIRKLIEQVRFVPQMGSHKVYIIDEVHMLSANAFNAFLKTLEEPPAYALFILATTEKHKILPTILSRCQIFDFKRITSYDTVRHLQEIADKENIRAEKAALEIIAQKSEGCMRDALSILDKIVSFSGGALTYQQTIEHLNILDADYHFRLLEKMQQQDLSDVLLLFDQINQKGFEGDVVLNSFAEFLRNLLVSKDPKAAELLEAVESFKNRYVTVSKELSASWIVSALSILNEAEMQYKQARNKRLHVEMTLIKLTYLNQALDGSGGKKKLNEATKPVRFRQLKPFQLAASSVPNKKTDSIAKEPPSQTSTSTVKKESTQTIIPEPAKIPVPQTPEQKPAAPAAPGKLASIRKKMADEAAKTRSKKPLDTHTLEDVRALYIGQLRDAKKFSAVTNFEMMTWQITGSEQIEIKCPGELQLGFLKQEKSFLTDFLQQYFSNPGINFLAVLEEQTATDEPGSAPLSRKDQYLKIIEKHPLVKTLKDRLGLDLDY
jgi:DNA polymerase-3 subunit gamma/tau